MKIVILNNIRSAHNVGAILRTADGAGIDKIYMCGITPDATHSKVQKTALGAEDFVNWEHYPDILSLISLLKTQGIQIVALEQTEISKNYAEFTFAENAAVILGHEITGVEDTVLSQCDAHVDIPMRGKKESLNVATAMGIIAYHLTNEPT